MSLINEQRLKRLERAIGKQSRVKGLVSVFLNAEGEIVYKTTFDGKEFKDAEDGLRSAIGHVEATGVNTYRVFGENQFGSTKGLDQIAEEAKVIQERLASLSRTQKAALKQLNLDDLINQSVSITYTKYNYDKDVNKLKSITDSDAVKNAGVVNITDEGVTVLNYRIGKKVLSDKQASELRYLLGIGTLTEDVVKKILEGKGGLPDFSPFAKIPKRISGMLAERDVALTGDAVQNMFKNTYEYDDVSAFFRAALGGATTEEERFLLSAGLDLSEERIKAATLAQGGVVPDDFTDAMGRKLLSVIGMERRPRDVKLKTLEQMKELFEKSGKDFGEFKKAVEQMKESADEGERLLANQLLAGFDGVEKMRDGEFIANVKVLDQFIDSLKNSRQSLIGSVTEISPEIMQQINDIDSQIESLEHAKQMGQEGLDSVIARIQLPGRQAKGEMFFRKFGWLPKGLRNMDLIMAKSAVKKEVQGVPSALLNVAKSHAENIYMDPLFMLYHQDYFSSAEYMSSINTNVNKQMDGIKQFLQSGALPKEVRDQIFGAIKQEMKEDPLFPKMDAAARASYLRNRTEARQIQEMIMAGVDVRQIPALVRRITDFYSQNAFRMKGDRADLVLPDTMRLALRTSESSGPMYADNVPLYRSASVNLDEGIFQGVYSGLRSSQEVKSVLGGAPEAGIDFVNFQVRGNRMIMNGAAANLYHHSLGTFDLDDKGVPLMTTFKDGKGRDRLAFMTLRQPTGYQEKIFMQADMSDADTLKAVIQHSSGDFMGLLSDPKAQDVISNSQLGLDATKSKRILDILREAAAGAKDLDLRNLTSEEIEMVIASLRESSLAEQHGFGKLAKITARDLLEMAHQRSASPIGLDRMEPTTVGGRAAFQRSLAERGIVADTPSYTQGNVVTILAQQESAAEENMLIKAVNRATGKNFTSRQQILDAFESGTGRSGQALRAQISGAMQRFGEQLQLSSIPDIEDTLGLYINRQAAAISMDRQIQDVIGSFGARTLKAGSTEYDIAEYFFSRFAVGVIPPSEAVDVSKALAGRMVVRQQSMQDVAAAADALRRSGRPVTEEAVEAILKQLNVGDLRLGQAGELAVRQMSQGVGFLRGLQLAAGVAAEDLIGYDQELFKFKGEKGKEFARIKARDLETMRISTIVGLRDSLNFITDQQQRNIILQEISRLEGSQGTRLQQLQQSLQSARSIAERQSIEDEIEAASSQRAEQAIRSLTIGTDSQYATLSAYGREARKATATAESLESLAARTARNAPNPLAAVQQARYLSTVDAAIDSQRSLINNAFDLIRMSTSEERLTDTAILLDASNSELSENLFKLISQARNKDASVNILDLYDTLESRLSSEFGDRVAKAAMGAELQIAGKNDAMTQLAEAAQARRVDRLTMKNSSFAAYERITAELSYLGLDIEDINQQTAKRLAEGMRSSMFAGTGGSILDFLEIMADESELVDAGGKTVEDLAEGIGRSQDAVDVARRVRAERRLAETERVYGGSAAGDFVIDSAEVGEDIIKTLEDVDDAIPPVRPTKYTRFKDAFKSEAIMDAFNDKLIRRGALAAVALSAFGFIYSARKDRTEDEIMGPPLLPGGSAYETDYPRNLPSISDLKYLNPTTLGMQYKINASGSEEQMQKLQALVGSVVDGPVDSTMYNSLPRLGRDPYNNIASNF
jgi:hypothetical protein